jgi:DNA-binding transcriptional MocR family regulator
MSKKEIIWREILYQALEKKQYRFTQKELAQKFKFSLSTVFNALKIPRSTGAIKVSGRFFTVTDKQKFLSIWSTHRRLTKDIIYQTKVDLPVQKIEGELPAEVIPTAYTAFRLKFKEAPADYDKVYVYAENLEQIKKRFSTKKGIPNLIILKADKFLKNYGLLAPLAQIYVDLWNLPEWYASDFLSILKEKI